MRHASGTLDRRGVEGTIAVAHADSQQASCQPFHDGDLKKDATGTCT